MCINTRIRNSRPEIQHLTERFKNQNPSAKFLVLAFELQTFIFQSGIANILRFFIIVYITNFLRHSPTTSHQFKTLKSISMDESEKKILLLK